MARWTVVNVNLGVFRSPWGTFTPTGRVQWHGTRPNPAEFEVQSASDKMLAANLYVGLSISKRPPDGAHPGKRRKTRKVPLRKVVHAVRDLRLAQVGIPDASFLSQLGLFRQPWGEIVEESSVRIVILKVLPDRRPKQAPAAQPGEPPIHESPTAFRLNMIALAKHLAGRFGQQSIIIEHQSAGVTKKTTFVARR